jgi:hypothetical protein
LENNAVTIITVENLFTQLWQLMYRHVVSYCELLSVPYENHMFPKIPDSDRFPVPDETEIGPHLAQLTRLVKQIINSYHK